MSITTTEVKNFCGAGEPWTGTHVIVVAPEFVEVLQVGDGDHLYIGRLHDCRVVLSDTLASRHHARLAFEPGRATIEDLGSRNGTRLNGSLIAAGLPTLLSPRDVVDIGTTRILIDDGPYFPGRRRVLSYDGLEAILEDTCSRLPKTEASVALLRWEVADVVAWPRIAAALCGAVPAHHVLAVYGVRHFLAMLFGVDAEAARKIAEDGKRALASQAGAVKFGLASSSSDGLGAQVLLERSVDDLRRVPTCASTESWDCENPEMRQALRLAERAAQSNISVLISGKTGVGKDVLARRIHALSSRNRAPMLSLNCGGLNEALLESELFGHERGSFSGAVTAKKGLLETADGGTVFLDEVGEIPLPIQVRLLRVLETKEFIPVGSVKARSVDVRFIAATNRDLEEACRTERFREDLFFRLAGIVIQIPPLKERRDEIPWLARHFVRLVCAGMRRSPELRLTVAAEDRLRRYDWPGNIRELRNVIERAVALSDGNEIDLDHLPSKVIAALVTSRSPVVTDGLVGMTVNPGDPQSPAQAHAQFDENEDEGARIVRLLREHGGNQSKTARALGVSRGTLIARLEKYGIPRPQKNALSLGGNGRS